jgi:hypothetical protein
MKEEILTKNQEKIAKDLAENIANEVFDFAIQNKNYDICKLIENGENVNIELLSQKSINDLTQVKKEFVNDFIKQTILS